MKGHHADLNVTMMEYVSHYAMQVVLQSLNGQCAGQVERSVSCCCIFYCRVCLFTTIELQMDMKWCRWQSTKIKLEELIRLPADSIWSLSDRRLTESDRMPPKTIYYDPNWYFALYRNMLSRNSYHIFQSLIYDVWRYMTRFFLTIHVPVNW